jgi:hypothetical protein
MPQLNIELSSPATREARLLDYALPAHRVTLTTLKASIIGQHWRSMLKQTQVFTRSLINRQIVLRQGRRYGAEDSTAC